MYEILGLYNINSNIISRTEITVRIWANKIIADSLFADRRRHEMSMTFATFLGVTISFVASIKQENGNDFVKSGCDAMPCGMIPFIKDVQRQT